MAPAEDVSDEASADWSEGETEESPGVASEEEASGLEEGSGEGSEEGSEEEASGEEGLEEGLAPIFESADELLPDYSPERGLLCELCGDGGYEDCQVVCENNRGDVPGCQGVRHLHCFQPPKSRDQMADERWHCMFCEAHGLKGGFPPLRRKKRVRSVSPPPERSAPAARRSKLLPPTKAVIADKEEEEQGRRANRDGVSLAKLAGGRPPGPPQVGQPAVRALQSRALPQHKRVEGGPSRGAGRGSQAKLNGSSVSKAPSTGGRAPGSLKDRQLQNVGPLVAAEERQPGPPKQQPAKVRAPGPPAEAAAKAAGTAGPAQRQAAAEAVRVPKVLAPGRRPPNQQSQTGSRQPADGANRGAAAPLQLPSKGCPAALVRSKAAVALAAQAAATMAAAAAASGAAAPAQQADPGATQRRLDIFKNELQGIQISHLRSEFTKKEESMKMPHETTCIGDHKGRCLWSGRIRVSRSEAGPLSTTADEQKLSAFEVQQCVDSEEAALKLPPLLEATVISADEADITAHMASQYAALIVGPQLGEPLSHGSLESLARSLGQDLVLRVELPARQVWLALVPDLSERSNSFWGVFVRTQSAEEAAGVASSVAQHSNKDLAPPRGILKPAPLPGMKAVAREARICWPDASRQDGPAAQFPALELCAGPLYSDAAKLAQLQRAEQAARATKLERDQIIQRKDAQASRYRNAPPLRGITGGGGGGMGASRLQAPLPTAPPPLDSAAMLIVSSAGHVEAERRPLDGIRFTMIGYPMTRDRSQEHYQVIDAVLKLGAELYRWPVSAAGVGVVILHEEVEAGGFEKANMNHELALNEFLSKECQFYAGLHYLRMAAALQRAPTLRERLQAHELLPCGVTVVLDAESAHRYPQEVHQLIKALQRGRDHCTRTHEWRLKMSEGERARLIAMYTDGPRGTGRPALVHLDRYSVHSYEGGRGVTSVLGPEEASASADRPGAPPQIVRDAVKVGFKHQRDCRHVVLAVADPAIRAIAANQRTLHSRTLPEAVRLVNDICSHLEQQNKGHPH